MNNEFFKRIVIIGAGLIGGSLYKALRINKPWLRVDVFDQATDLPRFVKSLEGIDGIDFADADLFVVATSPGSSIEIIKRIITRDDFNDNALIIDVGSTKQRIVDEIFLYDNKGRFVGCHPMTGSEKSGFHHSREDLFENQTVFITPHGNNSPAAIQKVISFWDSLQCITRTVSAVIHDKIVSYTSHMPHVVSAVIIKMMIDGCTKSISCENITDFIGSGFRDFTRIASGSPELWTDILLTNRKNILESIKELILYLEQFNEYLESDVVTAAGRVHDYFTESKLYRDETLGE